jgi:hypothetical protein
MDQQKVALKPTKTYRIDIGPSGASSMRLKNDTNNTVLRLKMLQIIQELA